MTKLNKLEKEQLKVLTDYLVNSTIKVDICWYSPVVFKIFTRSFDFSKLIKYGIPDSDFIDEYLDYPNIRAKELYWPKEYFTEWQDGNFNIDKVEFNQNHEFYQIRTGSNGDIQQTIYIKNGILNFKKSFEDLAKALENEELIKGHFKIETSEPDIVDENTFSIETSEPDIVDL